MKTYSAEYIKCKLIDYYLSNDSDIIIGNEIMYGKQKKVVDLLLIINNKLVAIEIKSDSDNLKRLPAQIEECNKVFDRVIVASSPLHIEKIRELLVLPVGLLSIEKDIKKIVSAKVNKKQKKVEMLYSISACYLKGLFPQYKNLNSDEIRNKLSMKKKEYIHHLLIDFYRTRLTERFKIFLGDRGEATVVDDIPTLSSFHIIESS